ncbi:phage tail tube protein [Nocardia thailandica]
MGIRSSKYIAAGAPAIATTGGIMVAPLGTTLPANESTAPNASFKALGYVSEDGLESQGERTTESVKDWNADIIAQLQTEHSVRFGFTLYNTFDPDVLKEVFGESNVTVTAATVSSGTKIKVIENGLVLPRRSWIFDMAHEGKKLRIVLPEAKISEVTESPMNTSQLMAFQCTVEAFPDSTGAKAIRYFDDGVFSV